MSLRETQEQALACACHVLARLVLRTARFRTFLRLAGLRLPSARHPLPLSRVEHLVHQSRRICGGSCLTASAVMKLLAVRHGHPQPPLTIAIARPEGLLRAHAWAGDGARPDGFVHLWSESSCPESPKQEA